MYVSFLELRESTFEKSEGSKLPSSSPIFSMIKLGWSVWSDCLHYGSITQDAFEAEKVPRMEVSGLVLIHLITRILIYGLDNNSLPRLCLSIGLSLRGVQ